MRASRLSQKKQYSERTREHRLNIAKVYREENKTRLREIQKKSVEKNKDHYREYKRQWYLDNKDRMSRASKKRYDERFSPKVKQCVVCGNDFDCKSRRGAAKTCSDECGETLMLPKRVFYDIKKDWGITPPADLVEEATALRLLNRALRHT
jgi:hypothetical protein